MRLCFLRVVSSSEYRPLGLAALFRNGHVEFQEEDFIYLILAINAGINGSRGRPCTGGTTLSLSI